jgi:hypothetical protein
MRRAIIDMALVAFAALALALTVGRYVSDHMGCPPEDVCQGREP